MKTKFVWLIFILPVIEIQAQRKVINVLRYYNSVMTLELNSMNSYRISSRWFKEEEPFLSDEADEKDDPNNIIEWSKGQIIYCNDTIICMDFSTKKMFLLEKVDY